MANLGGAAADPMARSGRIDPTTFGDRALRNKPPKLHRTNKHKQRLSPAGLPRRHAKRTRQDLSVLSTSLTAGAVYEPRAKDTRVAYQALLALLQHHLGPQPPAVLAGTAHQVLAVLNNTDKVGNGKEDIQTLLGPIQDHVLHQIVSTGSLITDFHAPAGSAADGMDMALDEDVGVAVVFQPSDESGDDTDFDHLQDEFSDDDGSGNLAGLSAAGATMHMGGYRCLLDSEEGIASIPGD